MVLITVGLYFLLSLSQIRKSTGDLWKVSLPNRTSIVDIKSLRLITAIKTPYLPDGRFDLEAYDALVNMQIENGAEGVIVGGTTGEG
ncbi:unnamed protein product [Ilex paraguariensis]|uniref:4-hydroxy-tetrahydrodipicolinate synthase n=1 Tax=Ilex paraguariensis TaxID=185542 RepID=A0ABC8TR94_9AQUA